MPGLVFLAAEDVLTLHHMILDAYGGVRGVLSDDALESAVAQAQTSWDGVFLHQDLAAMAAAYLYHIARGHPFADGNKRAASAAAFAFLLVNGYGLPEDNVEIRAAYEELVIRVASGEVTKPEVADFFRCYMELAEPEDE